jgi:hypothetical protein
MWPLSRRPPEPVRYAPRHGRDWRRLWSRRCHCGDRWPCPDRINPPPPVPPYPATRPGTLAGHRADAHRSPRRRKHDTNGEPPRSTEPDPPWPIPPGPAWPAYPGSGWNAPTQANWVGAAALLTLGQAARTGRTPR